MPSDQPRKRLQDIFLDPKAIAALFAPAIAAILFFISLVFDLWGKLPDAIKSRATTEQQHTSILLALSAIVALLLWIAFAILFSLWNLCWERRRHPDGKPKPGKLAIYVAELKGDDKEGSHRNHILLSLRQQLGASVQLLRAGIGPRAQEKGDPEDDALAANRQGHKYLNHKKYQGDLLIWGQIIQDSKLVEIRFTSRAHDGAEQMRFNFTEKMLLAPDFGSELATALAAIAAQLALPALNAGKYVADVLIPVAEKLRKIVANLPPSMGPDQRGLLLRSYADAELAIGEQHGNSDALIRAIAVYREALKEYAQESAPFEWATTQNKLGNALWRLGERESGTERLEAAVAACRDALKVWSQEMYPLQWAAMQNNLGAALCTLGERESGTERLEAAAAAYREALKQQTREKVPFDWAMTQNNLGTALGRLGMRESGTESLESAVAAFREALKEWTRKKVPLQWATTQNNLGIALGTLGEREGGTKRLEAAVAAFREALKVWTREKVPLDWAGTQNNLGDALESMGKLEEAAESFRLALQVFTPENHFPMYTGATNNLAHVLEKLRAGKENE